MLNVTVKLSCLWQNVCIALSLLQVLNLQQKQSTLPSNKHAHCTGTAYSSYSILGKCCNADYSKALLALLLDFFFCTGLGPYSWPKRYVAGFYCSC